MQKDFIEIRGARENNLKNVSLKIPKRKITIFTGVSGSGKSSIVFDTISTEAQRQLNETFSAFVRSRLPKYAQPDADAIENLSTPIIVDQKRLGGNSRSTMGTITDIYTLLRLLFSRVGQPFVGYSYVFSFNDPAGMCPGCDGIGSKVEIDINKFIDRSKSLNEGAILHPSFSVGTWYWNMYANSGIFDVDKKLSEYTEEEMQELLYGKDKKFAYKTQGGDIQASYEGIIEKFTRLYIKRDTSELSESTRANIQNYMTLVTCPVCHGARLNETILSCKINELNIAEMAAMEVTDLSDELDAIQDPIAEPIIEALQIRLQHLIAIGLGYLSLDRETSTLSGGESQRIKMVRHLSSNLTDMIYIFDEPSIGLHPRDVHRLNDLLQKLRDKGNTVLVVEHDRDVIKIADYIVDVGPKAGAHGGEIVYQGDVATLHGAPTLTGQYIDRVASLKPSFRQPTGQMKIANATLHNLKNVTVEIPVGVLTVVTGVAGSGKSTLINELFAESHPEAIVVDQSAVSTSIRSTPATYTGIMDDIRQLFAKANHVNASLFSFNSEGACPNCQGLGFLFTDLAFLEPIKTPCEICNGQRFKDEVLAYKLNDKSITDVLAMTTVEAVEFFDKKKLRQRLQALVDVGLDYLTLGQPLSTLSGGECQRLKLAGELHKNGSIYIMDEPTTGLHMSDVGNLLNVINRIVDGGNSVIVIEHNLDVIKNADWIIDLGPEAGHQGGEVIFTGTPQQLLLSEQSLTAEFLRRDLSTLPEYHFLESLNLPKGIAARDRLSIEGSSNVDIFALAAEFEATINGSWEEVLEKNEAKLIDAYARAGDMAYGTYLDALFRPIHRRLRELDLKIKPRLPGDFNSSREWGIPDESDQQRWMWSVVRGADGHPIGSLVSITYHDHTRFHLPRPPRLFALAETEKEEVVKALSQRSDDFKNALEFPEEYALYLKMLEEEEAVTSTEG